MKLFGSIQGTTKSGMIVTSSVEPQGLEETLELLGQFTGEEPVQALAAAGYRVMTRVMADAKEQTPVDTGALRASGIVEPPTISGSRAKVEAGFGGPAIAYALKQHEELSHRHTSGKAKYLEDPFRAHAANADREIADEIRAERMI